MTAKPNLPVSHEPQFLFYQTEDGRVKVEVRFEEKTVWLPQKLLAELFQVSVPTINEHIKGIYADGELEPEATIRKFRIVQSEGARQVSRQVDFYNLDMILAVGYRVRSHRGVQFRRWATERLREYLLKGFVLDDERLKATGGGGYFDELLARIRDIRSSEKVFWRKVLDIYATSIDYDPSAEMSQAFFATVQNKMHWAAHGHTAAEIIAARADADKPNMGLTSWTGTHPRKDDVGIAKNYLDEKELDALNRIVTLYLEFAELQALNRKSMYMRDWIVKLDDFLRISERDILTHAGKVSHENAELKAESEYRKYEQKRLAEPSQAEKDFEKAVKKLQKLKPPDKKARKPRGKLS
jgi:hypothetical protein